MPGTPVHGRAWPPASASAPRSRASCAPGTRWMPPPSPWDRRLPRPMPQGGSTLTRSPTCTRAAWLGRASERAGTLKDRAVRKTQSHTRRRRTSSPRRAPRAVSAPWGAAQGRATGGGMPGSSLGPRAPPGGSTGPSGPGSGTGQQACRHSPPPASKLGVPCRMTKCRKSGEAFIFTVPDRSPLRNCTYLPRHSGSDPTQGPPRANATARQSWGPGCPQLGDPAGRSPGAHDAAPALCWPCTHPAGGPRPHPAPRGVRPRAVRVLHPWVAMEK